ncbi:hypothetical protein GGR53DRAFT_470603 [Hypoxylon sp. FL1150]|nr:hypothetical protein GGR53DRAFT_470603 [Hypoxylon sp. FL1150]
MLLLLASRQEDLVGPIIPPPDGIQSNFDNPPNQNVLSRAIILCCLVLSTAFILLRSCARFQQATRPNIVDVSLALAFAIFIPCVYLCYRLTYTGGYFVHGWDVRLGDLPAFEHPHFVLNILYIVIITLIKIAILTEWTHIFVPRGTRPPFWWLCRITTGIVAVWGIISLVFVNINCTPYEANWNALLPSRMCRYNPSAMTLPGAAVNFLLDLVPLILPHRIIWNLQLSKSQKIGVSLAFAAGLLGVFAAVARLLLAAKFMESPDQLYFITVSELTSLVELTCGILVLCIPSTPKALSVFSFLRSRLGSLKRSRTELSHAHSLPITSNSSRYAQIDERSVIQLRNIQHRRQSCTK